MIYEQITLTDNKSSQKVVRPTGSRPQAIGKWIMTALFLTVMTAIYVSAFKANTHLDFNAFYVGGQIFAHGDYRGLYDLGVQKQYQEQFLGQQELPFISPPHVAALFAWVKGLSLNQAFLRWTVASMLMFAAAAILLQRMSNALGDANLFLALSVLYLPVDYSFFHGQLDSLILLAVVGAIELQRRHLEFSSGLVLCLALVKFPTVIPFVVVFALRRQWRSLAGIVVGSGVTLAGSVAVCGVNVLRTYSTFLATIGPHFAFLGIAPLSMPNLRGFIFALSKGHDTPMWLSLLAMVLLCVCVKQTWEDDIQGMCRVAAISVVANYHVNPHDLVLLLPLFAVTLPSIRWRTPSGALFVVLATPILHGFRLVLGGFWFVTPLVLVFLWLTLREDWGLVKSYSSPAVSQ